MSGLPDTAGAMTGQQCGWQEAGGRGGRERALCPGGSRQGGGAGPRATAGNNWPGRCAPAPSPRAGHRLLPLLPEPPPPLTPAALGSPPCTLRPSLHPAPFLAPCSPPCTLCPSLHPAPCASLGPPRAQKCGLPSRSHSPAASPGPAAGHQRAWGQVAKRSQSPGKKPGCREMGRGLLAGEGCLVRG